MTHAIEHREDGWYVMTPELADDVGPFEDEQCATRYAAWIEKGI